MDNTSSLDMAEVLQAAHDPQGLLESLDGSTAAALSICTASPTQQHAPLDMLGQNPTGLDSTFAAMSLATHQTQLKGVMEDLTAAIADNDNATRRTKLEALNKKVVEVFEPYTNQDKVIKTTAAAEAPKIKFIEPAWSLPLLLRWADVYSMNDIYNRNVAWRPEKMHGTAYDVRRPRVADPIHAANTAAAGYTVYDTVLGQGSERAVPEQQADANADPPRPHYTPAVPAKPEIPAHIGFPEIVTGKPLQWEGAQPVGKELQLYVYAGTAPHSPDQLDVCATLLKFEAWANASGYTERMCLDFLTTFTQAKFGPRGELPYAGLTATDWANQLVSVYFRPPPINRTEEVSGFVRLPEMNIRQAYNKLFNLYHQALYTVPDKDTRNSLASERIYHDILNLVSPVLSNQIKRIRQRNKANGQPHPITLDLHMISQSEELEPHYRPQYPLRLKPSAIDRINTVYANSMTLMDMRKAFPDHASQYERLSYGSHPPGYPAPGPDINVIGGVPAAGAARGLGQPIQGQPLQVGHNPNAVKNPAPLRRPLNTPQVPKVTTPQPMDTTQPPSGGSRPPSRGDSRSSSRSQSRSGTRGDTRRFSGRPDARGSSAPQQDGDRSRNRIKQDSRARQNEARERLQQQNRAVADDSRDKQQALTRMAIQAPLPAAPRAVTPDKSGSRTWTDASGHNKFVESPRTGRVTHSTAQNIDNGQNKKFVPTRVGFPGELGNMIGAAGDGATRDSANRRDTSSPYGRSQRPRPGSWGTDRFSSPSPVRDRNTATQPGYPRDFRGGSGTERFGRSPYREPARTGRILNAENVAYWKGKLCQTCKKPDHGSHVCPTVVCKYCKLHGEHKSPVYCEAARGAKATQTLAFLHPPTRSPSRSNRGTAAVNAISMEEFRSTHTALLDSLKQIVASHGTNMTGNEAEQQ